MEAECVVGEVDLFEELVEDVGFPSIKVFRMASSNSSIYRFIFSEGLFNHF
jgi:hypothetical protein